MTGVEIIEADPDNTVIDIYQGFHQDFKLSVPGRQFGKIYICLKLGFFKFF